MAGSCRPCTRTGESNSADDQSARDADHSPPVQDRDLESLRAVLEIVDKLNRAKIRESRSGDNESIRAQTLRRLRGEANEALQGDGFFLDGVLGGRWFASLDLPTEAPYDLQDRVAKLVVDALAPSAESALITPQTIRIPQLTPNSAPGHMHLSTPSGNH
jgi:hypothetical protein